MSSRPKKISQFYQQFKKEHPHEELLREDVHEARIDALEDQNLLQQQLIEELLNQNKQLNESLQLLYTKLK